MAFPASPTNGQIYVQSGTSYIYDSTYGVWNINTTAINADTLDGIDSTGFITSANGKAPDSNLLDGIDSTGFVRNGSYSGAQQVFLNRASSSTNGIQWYSTSYNAWCEYMAPTGSGHGPRGTLTSQSGSLVTSWALRSYIENAAGYGWTFESGTSGQTTPTVKFEIRSSDGSIYSQGSGTFAGNVTANSDERLKTNIRPIENALDIVCSLEGKLYTKDGVDNQIGMIAQQVEKVLPQMVQTADDEMGTKSLNYQNMVALLVEAVKEQQSQIEMLKHEIITLKGDGK